MAEAQALDLTLSAACRIFGSELSPYSVKVRSYFGYKGLPHEWLLRSPANQAEFQKYAKLPLVQTVTLAGLSATKITGLREHVHGKARGFMRKTLAVFAMSVTLTACGISTQQEIEMGQQAKQGLDMLNQISPGIATSVTTKKKKT